MTEEKRKPGRPTNAERKAREEATVSNQLARGPRPETRETKGRKKRVPLGTPKQKMGAPKRAGYVRRWVNDTPGRLIQAQEAGYEFVADEESAHEKGRAGARKLRVGVTEEKVSLYAYLMEIPEEFYNEDQALKQEPIDQFEDQLRHGGKVSGADRGRDSDAFYTPSEGISIKRGPLVS